MSVCLSLSLSVSFFRVFFFFRSCIVCHCLCLCLSFVPPFSLLYCLSLSRILFLSLCLFSFVFFFTFSFTLIKNEFYFAACYTVCSLPFLSFHYFIFIFCLYISPFFFVVIGLRVTDFPSASYTLLLFLPPLLLSLLSLSLSAILQGHFFLVASFSFWTGKCSLVSRDAAEHDEGNRTEPGEARLPSRVGWGWGWGGEG